MVISLDVHPRRSQAPKPLATLFTSVCRNLKTPKVGITMRNLTRNHLKHWLGRCIKIKIDKKDLLPGLDPSLGTHSLFAQEWVKWSGGGDEKFLGLIDIEVP